MAWRCDVFVRFVTLMMNRTFEPFRFSLLLAELLLATDCGQAVGEIGSSDSR